MLFTLLCIHFALRYVAIQRRYPEDYSEDKSYFFETSLEEKRDGNSVATWTDFTADLQSGYLTLDLFFFKNLLIFVKQE